MYTNKCRGASAYRVAPTFPSHFAVLIPATNHGRSARCPSPAAQRHQSDKIKMYWPPPLDPPHPKSIQRTPKEHTRAYRSRAAAVASGARPWHSRTPQGRHRSNGPLPLASESSMFNYRATEGQRTSEIGKKMVVNQAFIKLVLAIFAQTPAPGHVTCFRVLVVPRTIARTARHDTKERAHAEKVREMPK